MVCFSKKSNSTRAQASVEYIMLVGITLAIIGILSGYSFMLYSTTISNNQIQTSVKEIEKAVNEIYSLGEGNSTIIQVTLPSEISNITLGNNYLLIEVNSLGSTNQSLVEFDNNISGALPTQPGTYDIEVKNVNGVVNLNVA